MQGRAAAGRGTHLGLGVEKQRVGERRRHARAAGRRRRARQQRQPMPLCRPRLARRGCRQRRQRGAPHAAAPQPVSAGVAVRVRGVAVAPACTDRVTAEEAAQSCIASKRNPLIRCSPALLKSRIATLCFHSVRWVRAVKEHRQRTAALTVQAGRPALRRPVGAAGRAAEHLARCRRRQPQGLARPRASGRHAVIEKLAQAGHERVHVLRLHSLQVRV